MIRKVSGEKTNVSLLSIGSNVTPGTNSQANAFSQGLCITAFRPIHLDLRPVESNGLIFPGHIHISIWDYTKIEISSVSSSSIYKYAAALFKYIVASPNLHDK